MRAGRGRSGWGSGGGPGRRGRARAQMLRAALGACSHTHPWRAAGGDAARCALKLSVGRRVGLARGAACVGAGKAAAGWTAGAAKLGWQAVRRCQLSLAHAKAGGWGAVGRCQLSRRAHRPHPHPRPHSPARSASAGRLGGGTEGGVRQSFEAQGSVMCAVHRREKEVAEAAAAAAA